MNDVPMTLRWRAVPPQDWARLAPHVHRWNRRADGSVRCLHADQGPDVAAHAAELAALAADDAAFWLCRNDAGQPVGVIGCELDVAAQRAWLRGPLAASAAVLQAMGAGAMPRLQAALPQVRRWDAFPAADDEPLNAWYAAAGFTPLQLHRVLQAPARALAATPADARVRLVTPDDLRAAWALHGALFPSSYLWAEGFGREMPRRLLWVLPGNGGAMAGYLHAEDQPASDELYVDYLGVAEAERGRGIGAALLQRAAHGAVERGRTAVALTVGEDRPSALGLYARCGFVEVSAGRHWQRTSKIHD
jgi:ribosomal protein S18 acetylase RimI-like enzyme